MSTSAACLAPVNPPEVLFSVSRNGREIVCELVDHGKAGFEVQFLSDREPFYSLRLRTHELAVQWAEAERHAWGWTLCDEAAG